MDKLEILLKLYKEDKITTEEFKILSKDKEVINYIPLTDNRTSPYDPPFKPWVQEPYYYGTSELNNNYTNK